MTPPRSSTPTTTVNALPTGSENPAPNPNEGKGNTTPEDAAPIDDVAMEQDTEKVHTSHPTLLNET
jgi:hypothetical protein